MDVFRTIIIPVTKAPMARGLASALSRRGANMFIDGLSASGALPATHYVSTGYLSDALVALLTDASALHGAASAKGSNLTIQDCRGLVDTADVSVDEPFVAFQRLGLKLARG